MSFAAVLVIRQKILGPADPRSIPGIPKINSEEITVNRQPVRLKWTKDQTHLALDNGKVLAQKN